MSRSPAINIPDGKSQWASPPAFPVLGEGEVHVWRVGLEAENIGALEPILSRDELERAARFRFVRHRNEFIAARAGLRIILSKYLKTRPDQIGFEYGPFGKPLLARPWRDRISFSVSHSEGFALYAFFCNGDVGIDLEYVKPSDEKTSVECMTAAEIKTLESLPADERVRFFFESWTKKEELRKALASRKAALPANQIETCVVSDSVEMTGPAQARKERTSGWSFRVPPAMPGYAAAVAVDCKRVLCRYWMGDDILKDNIAGHRSRYMQ